MLKIRGDFERYKGITNEELKIKDMIVEKVTSLITKQMEEMRTLKTVISVPYLRNQLGQYEYRGVQYEDLLEQCYQIIRYAYKGQLIDQPILPLVSKSGKNSNGSLIREIQNLSIIENPLTHQKEAIDFPKFLKDH